VLIVSVLDSDLISVMFLAKNQEMHLAGKNFILAAIPLSEITARHVVRMVGCDINSRQ